MQPERPWNFKSSGFGQVGAVADGVSQTERGFNQDTNIGMRI